MRKQVFYLIKYAKSFISNIKVVILRKRERFYVIKLFGKIKRIGTNL